MIGELTLGKKGQTDSETKDSNVEDTINEYNNVIKIINDECKKVVTNNNKIKVRSVGAREDKTGEEDTYTSKMIKEWEAKYPYLTAYNGRGKRGDTYYEDDLVRMSYHNVANVESVYWVASRRAGRYYDSISFDVIFVFEGNFIWYYDLWNVVSNGGVESSSHSLGVRPVVTIQYPAS